MILGYRRLVTLPLRLAAGNYAIVNERKGLL